MDVNALKASVLNPMMIAGIFEAAIVAAAGAGDGQSGAIVAAVIAGVFLLLNTITMVVLTYYFTHRADRDHDHAEPAVVPVVEGGLDETRSA